MPKNVSSSSTNETIQEASPDSKFFYREWRRYCQDTGHLYIVESQGTDLFIGEIVGFLNYEHAIVEFLDDFDGIRITQIVELTTSGSPLFKVKAHAEQFIKQMESAEI